MDATTASSFSIPQPFVLRTPATLPAPSVRAASIEGKQPGGAVAAADGRDHGIADGGGGGRPSWWYNSLAPLTPERFGSGNECNAPLSNGTGLYVDLRG
ncbi:MAG TPA: hypothetical protein VG713_07085 [Pirellulales bacterium]|nr:hypothetical protein [Pirellulales bacterium]